MSTATAHRPLQLLTERQERMRQAYRELQREMVTLRAAFEGFERLADREEGLWSLPDTFWDALTAVETKIADLGLELDR